MGRMTPPKPPIDLDRRSFVCTLGAAALAAGGAPAPRPGAQSGAGTTGGGAPAPGTIRVIASGNGLPATALAFDMLGKGADPADAVVQGIALIENDPNDMSVGYGGLPNEDGVVELDASVMHGPTHKAGAVAALRNIKNPAAVALTVLRRTDHVLLVGEGALRFARAHGFQEENLLTEAARQAWLRWKESLSTEDDWLNDEQRDPPKGSKPAASAPIPWTTGTVHCAAVDRDGDLAACTSTSGLSYKIPGRVGDSPIVGAGMYCDNAVGAAGATGRGEAVIANCGAFSIVREMEHGAAPVDACLAVLKRIVDRTREKRLLDARGRPAFNVCVYALRKDGAYGSAAIYKGSDFAIHDGRENRRMPGAFLFE